MYTLAGMLPMASAILLLPFYIHYLSTTLYGVLSIYLAFSLLVQVVVTYSFDTSVFVHFQEFRNDPSTLKRFISSAFLLLLFIGVGIGLLLTGTGDLLFSFFLTDTQVSFYPFGLAAVGTGIFQSVFKVHSSLLQSNEKPVTFFWANVLLFMLIAAFTMVGLVIFPETLIGPIYGRLIAFALAGVWVLFRIFKAYGIQFDGKLLRTSMGFNTYQFVYQLQQWLINYFDRIVMMFYLPLSDIGMYDFAFKCVLFIEFLINGLNLSFFPKVVRTIMDQSVKMSTIEINRYFHGLIAVAMLAACGSIAVFPWLMDWFVANPAYRLSLEFIPYLASLYILKAIRMFFIVPYIAIKFSKPLPIIYAVVAVVKIGVIVLLASQYGVYGVIAASWISTLVELLLLRLVVSPLRFRFLFNPIKMLVVPLSLALIIVVSELNFAWKYPTLLHVSYVAICLLLLWWAYRNEIKQNLINSFFSK